MRVAALYDIHAMLDALDAALAEVDRARVDVVLLGGDVVGGPQPARVLARLRDVEPQLVWIRGNGERALGPDGVRALSGGEGATAALRFTWERLRPDDRRFLADLPTTATLDVDGLGPTLFCHATPQNDVDLITRATPDRVLLRLAEGVAERTIVSGHTHMQFDRRVGDLRWVNAGSVGMPFEGRVAAFWALLGPDVELRQTPFDAERAAAAILASGWPERDAFVAGNVQRAESREAATELFERMAAERGQRG
jgi:predicted phosphodiesterase